MRSSLRFAHRLLEQPIVRHLADPVLTSADQWNPVGASLNALSKRAMDLQAALRQAVPDPPPSSFVVRIPESQNLEDLGAVMRALHIAFDQPVARLSDATVSIHGFDTGSMWIEFATSTAGLAVVAALIKAVAEFRVKGASVRHTDELTRTLAIDNDHRQAIMKATEPLIDALARRIAESVVAPDAGSDPAQPVAKPPDPEQINAVFHAIKQLDALVDRGADVRLGPGAPPALRALVPATLHGSSGAPAALPPPPKPKT